MKQRLFAIWKYDLPPYYLGAEVIKILNNGHVKVVGYDSLYFKYEKIYTLEEGLLVMEKINEASNIYKKEKRESKDRMVQKIKEII